MNLRSLQIQSVDGVFLILIAGLALFGCLMVYSASSHYAAQNHSTSFYYFGRQLIWLSISVIGGLGAYLIGYRRLVENSVLLVIVSFILLVLVLFLPPIRNVHRWIQMGPVNFQPSEMARISVILFFTLVLAHKNDKGVDPGKYITLIAAATVIGGLIVIEPDIGNTLALTASLGAVLYLSGCRKRYLALTASLMVMIVGVMIFGFGYEQDRLVEYISGLKNPFDSQYQVLQGLIAIGSGGLFGTGLGEGGQKLLFLPEPYSDFIFASTAEETGIIITLPLITIFTLIFLRGCRIARESRDAEGTIVTYGLSTMIVASAFINIGVVMGVLPVTGLPLPFISYGGSSLLFNMIAAGIILSVSGISGEKSKSRTHSGTGRDSFDRYHIRRRWYGRSYLPGTGGGRTYNGKKAGR
jgi:cell division protein FtsW